MSRHRNRITKASRRTERARQWREEQRALKKSKGRVVYDRERGIGSIPPNLLSPSTSRRGSSGK